MRAIAFLLVLLLPIAAARADGGFNFSNAPNANNLTGTAVTCGATSTALGVTGNSYLSISIPPGPATQTVCFAWGPSATATMSPPSECFTQGALFSFAGGTGACIVASGSQAITVETLSK